MKGRGPRRRNGAHALVAADGQQTLLKLVAGAAAQRMGGEGPCTAHRPRGSRTASERRPGSAARDAVEDSLHESGIAEEVGHGVGDVGRCEAAAAVDVEGGEDPEQDEGEGHVGGPDVVPDHAVVDAHDGPGDHDLDEAARAAAPEPVQDKAAHRDLLAEGKDEANDHHDRSLPGPGQRVPSAGVRHRRPGQSVDDGDDEDRRSRGPAPAELGEALALPVLAPADEADDHQAAHQEDHIEREGGVEAPPPLVVDLLGSGEEAGPAENEPQHHGGEADLSPRHGPAQGGTRVDGGGRRT